jgi:hypothetical protein
VDVLGLVGVEPFPLPIPTELQGSDGSTYIPQPLIAAAESAAAGALLGASKGLHGATAGAAGVFFGSLLVNLFKMLKDLLGGGGDEDGDSDCPQPTPIPGNQLPR